MKLSRVNNSVKPLLSVTARNSSHFTYVPDAPMENMGKLIKLVKILGSTQFDEFI